jgi:PGF-pre-PGF domain-containing protein
MLEEKIMRNILRVMTAIILIGSTIGAAFGATIAFDKIIDVPDRDFTVTYQDSTFSFITDNLGNYKFGDSIGVTVNGGVNRMRLVIWSVDKLSTWSESFENPGGSISTTIPADRFDPGCPGVCDNNKMGPGIYALTVQDMVNGPPYNYITTKPFIISEYDLAVTPDRTQVEPGSSINVTVLISKSGSLVDVSNNVKVEFVQDSTNTHFGAYATKISTGTYEARIPIPQTASGTHLLYAAITTNKSIYQDYPEIMGAAGYNGTIELLTPISTTSTGGGGGGGSAPSVEELKNIELKETYEKYISKDAAASYVFMLAGIPVSEVVITSNVNAGDIAVEIEVLRGISSLVSSPVSGTVYKNINILVGKSGFAVPKNIKEAVIKFRVENSWITGNNLANSDVNMVKWDGSKWAKVDTSLKNRDEIYTYYEAKTDSFSAFAITGMKEVVVPAATSVIEATEKVASIETTPVAVPTDKKAPEFETIIAVFAMLTTRFKNNRK